jgi:hypothetical protein
LPHKLSMIGLTLLFQVDSPVEVVGGFKLKGKRLYQFDEVKALPEQKTETNKKLVLSSFFANSLSSSNKGVIKQLLSPLSIAAHRPCKHARSRRWSLST